MYIEQHQTQSSCLKRSKPETQYEHDYSAASYLHLRCADIANSFFVPDGSNTSLGCQLTVSQRLWWRGRCEHGGWQREVAVTETITLAEEMADFHPIVFGVCGVGCHQQREELLVAPFTKQAEN